MVLWEITLATAYFLGLKRTYRLALRIQKRVIGSKHPKIRMFVHRRIRSAFDVAVSVHKNIQQRDIEVGRNLGNRILRWLDRMKPSAEINPPNKINHMNTNIPKPTSTEPTQKLRTKISEHDSKGKLFFTPLRTKSFPNIAVMMQPIKSAGMNGQIRQISHFPVANSGAVFRKDIAFLVMGY